MKARSPGEHPHADQPNFTLADYLAMCRDGKATFSVSEVARLMGVSRMHVHRMMLMAEVTAEEFEEVLDALKAKNVALTTTAVADEVKRRLGKAREYHESCPNCGHLLRTRRR